MKETIQSICMVAGIVLLGAAAALFFLLYTIVVMPLYLVQAIIQARKPASNQRKGLDQ